LFPKISRRQPQGPDLKTLRALIFDLDGTLLDTAPGLTEALNQALAEAGRRPVPLADVKPMIGDGVDKLIERALTATGGALPLFAQAKLAARYRSLMRAAPQPPLFSGSREALATLNERGIKLAVCTNKPEVAAFDVLDRCGLTAFLEAVVGADTAPLKPDPTMVRRALALLETESDAAVLVGDSEVDVATGRAAGLPVVLLAHGYARGPLAEAGADAIVGNFAVLAAALESLGFMFP
jgi:phosphoglycolate phosphatase